jgi:hypothetical protein
MDKGAFDFTPYVENLAGIICAANMPWTIDALGGFDYKS